ncbi:purine-nucleoside phosphorylase [Dictyobacter alpinus]|uniref:Uridine phosphorylase n=1 Tax=Dictyobacter alpinus TaxID=2014873 RepID=A0A402B8S8_9CHLR|nr:nucleoside phosphorylase [Dictyobacter alpinus]GCE27727.1 purine-nucleoside phosphorylase [Dictyobacter alpinus]
MKQEYPILEFDRTPEAMLEPSRLIRPMDISPHAVVCFFQDVITTLIHKHQARVIHNLSSEIGAHPIYEVEIEQRKLTVFHPGIGAPLSAALLEEVIALGCNKFIACGGAGVLDSSLAVGHVVVPTAAIRDEGVSYHYLPPGREVLAHPEGVQAIEAVLQKHHCAYVLGKTWTTDAIYRETPQKVQLRRQEGCITVEMEAAAFFAVSQFRNVQFAQLLYGGDDVGSEQWDGRDWTRQTSVREKLFWLAAEACLAL